MIKIIFYFFLYVSSLSIKANDEQPVALGNLDRVLDIAHEEEDLWAKSEVYNPSLEWKKKWVKTATCGCITEQDERAITKALFYLSGVHWKKIGAAIAVPGTLWVFFFNLKLLGNGFKLLGGKDSAKMFDMASNPFSSLMIGTLATVLVQSSSTSTSIIISLVGAGELSVRNAISMIMGANIGTTVTNTIVSHGHIKDPKEFSKAFSSATVHDLFNLLSVLVYFPLQWGTNFLGDLTGEISKNNEACNSLNESCSKWKDPISRIVGPAAGEIALLNKKVISAIATGKCDNTTLCDQNILAGGLLHDADFSDEEAGIFCTIVPILGLSFCLYGLVKSLNYLIKGKAAQALRKALDYNGYLSIVIGCAVTIAVQSSSITTSTLTPLCASGLISLEQAYPLTLGANIGTCVTGILAALVATSHSQEAMQVALSHLSFNLLGILTWYPVPSLRKIPIRGAEQLGKIAEQKKWFPLVYTFGVFLALPAACYGISSASQ